MIKTLLIKFAFDTVLELICVILDDMVNDHDNDVDQEFSNNFCRNASKIRARAKANNPDYD